MVVGADIAELLVKGHGHESPTRPLSVTSNTSSAINEVNTASEISYVQNLDNQNNTAMSPIKEEFVTNKFREYLLYGSGKEALGMFSYYRLLLSTNLFSYLSMLFQFPKCITYFFQSLSPLPTSISVFIFFYYFEIG